MGKDVNMPTWKEKTGILLIEIKRMHVKRKQPFGNPFSSLSFSLSFFEPCFTRPALMVCFCVSYRISYVYLLVHIEL